MKSGDGRSAGGTDRQGGSSRGRVAWRAALGGFVAGLGYTLFSRWRTAGSDDGTGVAVENGAPLAHTSGRVLAGTIDERPAAGDPGRVYLATDTGGRFLDSGTRWDALDLAAPEGTFETVRATKAITARAPMYNVQVQGAAGNGEHDDTETIQRVLDAIEEAGGGVVRFPPGEYRTTHTLLYGSNTVLTGPGATISFDPTDPDATALVSRSFDGSVETRNVTIEGLAVESVDPEKGNGIGVAKAKSVTIQGCQTHSLFWHLVDVAGGKDVSVRDCYAANLDTVAYQADNLTEEGGLVVEHPDGTLEDAIPDGTENENVDIESNITEDCARGVHLHRSGGHDLTVRENKFRRCTDAGILGDVDTHWHDVIVSDNIVEGDGTSSGIDLQGEYTNLSVEDNTVRNHEYGIAVRPADSAGGRPDEGGDANDDDAENDDSDDNGDDGPDLGSQNGADDDDKRDTIAAGVTIGDNTLARIDRVAIALEGISGHVSDNYVHGVGGEHDTADRAIRADDAADPVDSDGDGGDDSEASDGDAGSKNEASDPDAPSDLARSADLADSPDSLAREPIGVSITDCDGITITDNVFRNVTGTGILVGAGSSDVVISENNVNGFRVAVALYSADGSIRGADVKDNRFVGHALATWAVLAEGGSGFRIEDNAIAGVRQGGVRCTNATDVHVGNNDATGENGVQGYVLRSCSGVELHDNSARRFSSPITLEGVAEARGTLDYIGGDGDAVDRALAVDAECTGVSLTFAGIRPPESGAFGVGSRVENTEPAPGDPLGWVCVAAGVPGTWKPYGVIGD